MNGLDEYFNQQRAAYFADRARQQLQADAEGISLDQVQKRERDAAQAVAEADQRKKDAAELAAWRAQRERIAEAEAEQQQAREAQAPREAAALAASQAHWRAVEHGTWTPGADGVYPPTTYGAGS